MGQGLFTNQSVGNYNILKKYGNNMNWMSDNLHNIESLTLRELILPGTCYSGSYCCKDRSKRTQILPIYSQQQLGIRYQELNLGNGTIKSNIEDVYVIHTPLKGGESMMLITALKELKCFFDNFTTEFAIIVVKEEKEISSEQAYYVRDIIEAILGRDKMITKDDELDWFDISTTTIGEIFKRNKNYLVLVDLNLLRDDQVSGVGKKTYLDCQNYMDDWHILTRYKEELFSTAIKNFKETNIIESRIQCNKIILYQDWHQKKCLKDLFQCKNWSSYYRLQELIKELELNYFLRHSLKWNINIVCQDFIDCYPDLVTFQLASNFKTRKLNIQRAIFNNRDYTQIVTSLVTRGNVLYIPNPNYELSLKAELGFFYIIYNFDNEPLRVQVYKIENISPILLFWTGYQNYQHKPRNLVAIFIDEFDKTEKAIEYIGKNYAFNIMHFDVKNPICLSIITSNDDQSGYGIEIKSVYGCERITEFIV